MSKPLTLDSVVCPGCGQQLPVRNTGCPHCHYEDPVSGRIMRVSEYLKVDNLALNQVCAEFLRKVVTAAQQTNS